MAYANRWCSTFNCVNRKSDGGSFLATYLTQNFRLTKLSAAKAAEDANVDNVNAIVAFFKEQGFTNEQIGKVLRVRPVLLTFSTQTIKPKIEFLRSKIADSSEVSRVIATYPSLLSASLEKRLIPSFSFLSSILGSENEASMAVRRIGDILLLNPESSAARNLEHLIKCGVPRLKLVILFRHRCSAVKISSVQFEEAIEEIKEMGFSPYTSKFVIALTVRLTLRKELWEQKVRLYRNCGLSEEEFMLAFRINPYIAICNGDKITKMINYFKELGFEPCRIAKYPLVLGMSFEKRIIPRAFVYKVLASEGLLDEAVNLHLVFCSTEDTFLRRYIRRYHKVDGLRKLYEEKLKLSRQNCTSS